MNDKEKIEILTKVYGYVNRIKVFLALKDISGVWGALNDLSEYLVSVDCTPEDEKLIDIRKPTDEMQK